TTAAPSASAVANDTQAEARALAMTPPAGGTPIDAEILLQQKNAESPSRANDALNLLGRAWIKKARTTADPGFYLHAKACADLVLASAPDDRMALNLVALVALNQHRFTDAFDTAQRILGKDPEDVD